jgi:hypothetical protein
VNARRGIEGMCSGLHRAGGGLETQRQTGSLPSMFQAAVRANLANAGSDFDPDFFVMEARWFSTVR